MNSFVILEKAPEVGGTWWYNKYPGCACDIPSHLYSFSFCPKYDWSKVYPTQPEILQYLKDVTQKYQLYPHIRFNRPVQDASWDGQWRVRTATGELYVSQFLVLGVGALHVPSYPMGHNQFVGRMVHTGEWDPTIDLKDKTVAFVGSGASAVQAVPEVAKTAKQVYVFQRTASWVSEKKDGAYGRLFSWALKWVPGVRQLLRWFYYWRGELFFRLVFTPTQPKTNRDDIEGKLTQRIHDEVKDKSLWDDLTPKYMVGCKRVLISNDYYKSFNEPNVKFIPRHVDSFGDHSVTSKGEKYDVDVVVCATGFKVGRGLQFVHGKDGKDMEEQWNDCQAAHHGITVPNFPNAFILLGPGTALGHNSVVWMIEVQLSYIIQLMTHMRKAGHAVCEVKNDVWAKSVAENQKGLENKVWQRNIGWYQNKQGKLYTLWRGQTFSYWWTCRTPRFNDFYFA
eukprot:TRINITY_DN67796_c3_g1_i3.p1 TRINITY_DN67796_c3_g1~~TRINITY_DN67796_c3_g1_i3.p1  ORF type:complete len:498 (+),score=37.41 TRINITY_DN67796_c3_g1_i3:139-1494(+)